ncbi:MAG: hypothetical protein KME29_35980 [Calothrix sp. FI2-JRJ7]|jgi:hypothetical protein|nr:hypothetical protein [Calothrix sp. FI2-JRJ7]
MESTFEDKQRIKTFKSLGFSPSYAFDVEASDDCWAIITSEVSPIALFTS